ncbi:MAG: hypothetical protein ACYS47_14240, partial [Planctomycetota bacterium]
RFPSPAELIAAVEGAEKGISPETPEGAPAILTADETSGMMDRLTTTIRSGVGRTADAVGDEIQGWFRSRFFLFAGGIGTILLLAALGLALFGGGIGGAKGSHDPLADFGNNDELDSGENAGKETETKLPGNEPSAENPSSKGGGETPNKPPPSSEENGQGLAHGLIESARGLRDAIEHFDRQDKEIPESLVNEFIDVVRQMQDHLKQLEKRFEDRERKRDE